jgi:hypothetical protein
MPKPRNLPRGSLEGHGNTPRRSRSACDKYRDEIFRGEDAQPGRQYDVGPDGRFIIDTALESFAAPITASGAEGYGSSRPRLRRPTAAAWRQKYAFTNLSCRIYAVGR